MSLDSKKGLFLLGIIAGLAAMVLAIWGNPKNMAMCIACFIRDTAGSFKLHQAEVVQYFRPEIVGIVLGAFLISLFTKEYRSPGGSAPAIRFLLGAIMVICALVFLGCPLRMVLRMSAGDISGYVGLVGFALGVGTGAFFLKKRIQPRKILYYQKRKRICTSITYHHCIFSKSFCTFTFCF